MDQEARAREATEHTEVKVRRQVQIKVTLETRTIRAKEVRS